MDPNYLIAILAFLTIGGVMALAIFHFKFYLKDPKNLEAARIVAADLESATTRVSSEGVNGRSLRQRLDEAPSIDDRLSNRPTGLSPVDVMFTVSWSDFRRTLTGENAASGEGRQAPSSNTRH